MKNTSRSLVWMLVIAVQSGGDAFLHVGTLAPASHFRSSARAPDALSQQGPLLRYCYQDAGLVLTASKVDSEPIMSPPEERVHGILENLHTSQYPFRVVVVGNGAILETTSALGPVMKLNQSPQTGENLLTFASADQSFEFHLKIAQVSKIVLTEKQGPNGIMRIFRFLMDDGKPMCSLILADKSERAAKWFQEIMDKYGSEMQL